MPGRCPGATAPPNLIGESFDVSLTEGTSLFPGPCAGGRAGATVYRIEVTEPSALIVATGIGAGEGVLHVAKGECGPGQETLICDSFTGDFTLRFTDMVDPGVYFASVAPVGTPEVGYAPLRIRVESRADLLARCEAAPRIVHGATMRGTMSGATDRYPIPYYPYMNGTERLFRLDLEGSSRVKIEVAGHESSALTWVDECPMDRLSSRDTDHYDASQEDEEDVAERPPGDREEFAYTTHLGAGTHYLLLDMYSGVEFTIRSEIVPTP
ncbi:MAG: hypothetical protein DRJ42_06590 [Deltaproteobacteria bacterium]|nr:MAG: hypothetical protein DRJ42_06590 [Deltaproteobacteria bacterium]